MHTTYKRVQHSRKGRPNPASRACRNQQALEDVWSEVKRLKALRHQADLTPERKIEKTKKYLVRSCLTSRVSALHHPFSIAKHATQHKLTMYMSYSS